MEYCGGGSVSDIMRMRKKTLTEDEISTILRDTLLGLEYLHARRKIHRDIKAGNILLNSEGHAKLGHYLSIFLSHRLYLPIKVYLFQYCYGLSFVSGFDL